MTETGHREPTSEVKELARRWLVLSRMKKIPLASLAKHPDRLDALFRGALLAAANAVDNRAGLVNFKRRLASFLSKFGGWLGADAEAVTAMMAGCGVISVTGGRVQVQLRLPDYRADAFEDFTTQLSALLEKEGEARSARRAALQQKNRTVNAAAGPRIDEALDRLIMKEALLEAEAAGVRGEVPVGAVVAVDGNIVARAGNRVRELKDPTAHAEILAIRKAAAVLGNERLVGAVLYVTLEPCAMCAAASSLARVGRIVWGADDPERGGAASTVNVIEATRMTTKPVMTRGVEACRCREVLTHFFSARRVKKEQQNDRTHRT